MRAIRVAFFFFVSLSFYDVKSCSTIITKKPPKTIVNTVGTKYVCRCVYDDGLPYSAAFHIIFYHTSIASKISPDTYVLRFRDGMKNIHSEIVKQAIATRNKVESSA